jgi:hypothetical protein
MTAMFAPSRRAIETSDLSVIFVTARA